MLKNGQTVTVDMLDIIKQNSLADCTPTTATPCVNAPWPCKSKKDENPMNTAYATATLVSADTTEKDQRRYLLDELYRAYETAKLALQRKFGLADDEAPVSLMDTIKRIQDGLFVIPEKYKDKNTYGSLSYLRWRDPKTVEDKAGYEAAKAPLKAARTNTERQIKIFSPEKGLQSIIDFEAAAAK